MQITNTELTFLALISIDICGCLILLSAIVSTISSYRCATRFSCPLRRAEPWRMDYRRRWISCPLIMTNWSRWRNRPWKLFWKAMVQNDCLLGKQLKISGCVGLRLCVRSSRLCFKIGSLFCVIHLACQRRRLLLAWAVRLIEQKLFGLNKHKLWKSWAWSRSSRC